MAQHLDIAVVNADGMHEHPSQALLDAYTILLTKSPARDCTSRSRRYPPQPRGPLGLHLLTAGAKITLCVRRVRAGRGGALAPGCSLPHIEDAVRGADC